MKKWLLHIAAVSIVVIFAGLLIVYHSAGARHREALTCTGVSICVTDSTLNSFISSADVKKYLDAEYGNMYTREIESFCDSLINNKPLEVPASDAVHVQEIIEKAYRSTKENRIFEILN